MPCRLRPLAALALTLTLAQSLLACSSSDTGGEPQGPTVLPGPPEWNREVTPPTDTEAADKRASCGYTLGSLPAETQGESTPSGKDIPVDHILVLMMENRSFDHYFQKLPEYGQPDVNLQFREVARNKANSQDDHNQSESAKSGWFPMRVAEQFAVGPELLFGRSGSAECFPLLGFLQLPPNQHAQQRGQPSNDEHPAPAAGDRAC